MPRCPDCGGRMKYQRDTKVYVCTSCGLTLTPEELQLRTAGEEEERGDRAREYLEWWLSGKK